MKKKMFQFFIILLPVFFLGCQLTPTFTATYDFDSAKLFNKPIGETLAVSRFEDSRPPRKYSSTGKIFLTYIPLIPYVTLPYERLDESVRKISQEIEGGGRGMTLCAHQNVAPEYETYTYPASFARTIAEDFKASGIFEDVVYVDEDSAERVKDYRYHLSGNICESPFNKSVTSYGLGMAGVLLWFLPIPMEKVTGEVTLELILSDTKNGNVVWSHKIKSKISRFITLYTSSAMVYGRAGAFSLNVEPPPSDARVDRRSLFSWHFEALRRGVVDAKPVIVKAILANP